MHHFLKLTPYLLLVMCLTLPVRAHHTWVLEYERDEVVVIKGKISRLRLTSPHSRIYVDVVGDESITGTWVGETWPLGTLYRRGLTQQTMAVGDEVIMTGERATKGRKGMHIRTIFRPSDGKRFWIGLGSDTGENTADGIGEGINTIQLEDESYR